MATKTAILSVKIVSDAKDFSSKMDTSVSKLDKFQSIANKLAVPATAVLAGLGAIAVGAGKMASEAEQNFGAVDAVFKDHANSVKEMAKTSAQNLGLSGSDYAKYSALLGSQLKNAGVPMEALAGQTDKLIGYGADFAAQFGGTVPDAVDALSSALKGEMDPIEKYGISLSETKVKAQMAADGTDKLTGAAYDQAKAAAIMTLIQNQGKDALGAFGREAGTAAGQQAIATAKWQDASVALGTVLLPIMTQAATILADVAKWVQENTGFVQTLVVGIAILAAGILVLNVAMMIMNAIALVNPWVILAVAVVALVGFIVYLATQTTFFGDLWTNVSKFAGEAWNNFINFITVLWNAWFNLIRSVLTNIGNFFQSVFSNIGSFVGGVVRNIQSFFASGFAFIGSIVSNYINFIIAVISGIVGAVSNVTNFVSSAFSSAFSFAQSVVSGVINFIVGGFNNIVGAVQNAINWVRNLFNGFSVPGWLKDVMKFMGVGGTGFEFSGAFAMVPGELGIGATGGSSLGALMGSRNGGKTEVNNYHITVNGALDERSTARQIKSILTNDAQRTGRLEVGVGIW
jgi:phage-related protein